jgi:hypothetical protein
LTVFPPNDIQTTIWVLNYQITRKIASKGTICRPFRTFNKCLGGLLRLIQIAAAGEMAFDEKFASASDRY